jgi:hypothetical protein
LRVELERVPETLHQRAGEARRPDAVLSDPLLTAQGLLMYFEPDAVHGLIAACAARFGGASLVFDAVPAWLAARSRQGG